MDDKTAVCEILFLSLLFVQGAESVLKCYECSDSFKGTWDPYTPCQVNATAVSVATCLDSDNFCMVYRVTVEGITIKITRSCAGECYYGCTFYGYGVTQLRCTSCCNQSLCNTGSGASAAAGLPFSLPHASKLWTCYYTLLCLVCVVAYGVCVLDICGGVWRT